MIITRIAVLLAVLSLLFAVYSGAHFIPALIRCGVVFAVAFAVLFIVQITLMYAYRKAKEVEYDETENADTSEEIRK